MDDSFLEIHSQYMDDTSHRHVTASNIFFAMNPEPSEDFDPRTREYRKRCLKCYLKRIVTEKYARGLFRLCFANLGENGAF
jgi:hypothetical protein